MLLLLRANAVAVSATIAISYGLAAPASRAAPGAATLASSFSASADASGVKRRSAAISVTTTLAAAGRKPSLANYYLSSAGYTAVAAWSASQVVAVGAYRKQTGSPALGNARVFRCTTAGTTGAVEPTWVLTAGATTTDNTAVWTECTGREADQSAGSWTAPARSIQDLYSLLAMTSADTIYVASNHDDTQTSAYNIGTNDPTRVICVTVAGGSMPPVSADLVTTPSAIFGHTAAGNMNIGKGYYYGVQFRPGAGSAAIGIVLGASTTSDALTLDTCSIDFSLNTNSTSACAFGNTSSGLVSADVINTVLKFNNTGQQVWISFADVHWRDTPDILGGSTIVPAGSSFFAVGSGVGRRAKVRFTDVGFQTITGTGLWNVAVDSYAEFENCRFGTSPRNAVGGTPLALSAMGAFVRMYNCDDNSNNRNPQLLEWHPNGIVEADTTVWRTSGATDTINPWSVRLETRVDGQKWYPTKFPRVHKRRNLTGIPVTATIEFIWNGSALPTKRELFMEVVSLESTSNPLGTRRTSRASILDTGAIATSSLPWSCTTARANSTAVTVGQVRRVASNSGRLFICTTAGTTSATEPGAFAAAVDGGSVTDGTAVWQCMMRGKVTVTFTNTRVGVVTATVSYAPDTAEPSAGVFRMFVDPFLAIA